MIVSHFSLTEQKLIKMIISVKHKNKARDIKGIYNYGYDLKLTDEQISNCLQFVGF